MDENVISHEETDYDLAKHYFKRWNRICINRGLVVEHDLFAGESSDDESEDEKPEDEKPAPVWKEAIPSKKAQKDNILKAILSYRWPASFNPQADNMYFFWQFLSSACLLYNACFIPFRSSFPYQTAENMHIWLAVDYVADVVYLFDVCFLQRRRQYLDGGCEVVDSEKTRSFYYRSNRFKRDVASLIPMDFLYFFIGVKPIVRINRLLKIDSYFEFNNLCEMRLKQAHLFRVIRTTAYLLYVIHCDACLYYYISYLKKFESPWGYNLEGNAYVRCYFWAFMNTTNIGNLPEPSITSEYVLQIFHYFLGLFIFSIVIGQVRDSVQAATSEEEAYRKKKNACINYLQKNNIPINVQKKVRLWFEYTWNTQRILDEDGLLKQMPGKMHMEIAINVHMDVLQKVEIFKECDRQLLYDLLTKLKPVLYLPGDYVCKKGEVGREMYIITNGMVQVVGETPSQVFASLQPGTAFGEISLLAVGGGNRRTANIYSPCYTTLFILYKNDLNEVLLNYPEAQRILKKKAKKMLNKDQVKKQPILFSSAGPKSTKKLEMTGVIALLRGVKLGNKKTD